ncbi:sulfatase-like hydrolase/transferase [Pseudomonas abyssi]|uniref:sulfatase-like hydrolase/transferase n=1 Tax=Pseudomonas abyssi TaxID=170540 RepID=UPI003C7D92E8
MNKANNITITLACIAAPNLAFFCVASYFDLNRPWLNLDYSIVVLLFSFGWRKAGALALLIAMVLDCLALLTQLLPFSRIADLIYLASFLPSASTYHITVISLASLTIALIFTSSVKLNRHASKMTALVALNIAVLVQIIFSASMAPEAENDTSYRKAVEGPVYSQGLNLYRMRSNIFLEMFEDQKVTLKKIAPGATASTFEALDKGAAPERILLIVSESWGVPKNDSVQAALLAPLEKVRNSTYSYGTFRRAGFTIDGELRELCRTRPSHFNLSNVNSGFENCLPNLLDARGYHTAAMHGASGLMYNRLAWYPKVGFDETYFFENLSWHRRCYSFPGACDLDLFDNVKAYFGKPGKKFFYWLTLNSHSSYDPRDIEVEYLDCEQLGIRKKTESCRNLQLHAQFFHGLAALLQTNELRDVEVIVVGDHTPVILDQAEKSAYFLDRAIPWIKLPPIPAAATIR